MTPTILTLNQINQPRIVTREQLLTKLIPLCRGYAWATDTINDLWLLGTPIPIKAGEAEKRILSPGLFKKWWDDLYQKLDHEETASEQYTKLANRLPTNSSGG